MIEVDDEQMKALASADVDRKIVEHLREHFPEHCRALGEGGVQQVIERTQERAGGYGIEDPVDRCRFLSLVFLLGEDFDELPWARAVLEREDVTEPGKRLHLLFEAAADELNHAAEDDDPWT